MIKILTPTKNSPDLDQPQTFTLHSKITHTNFQPFQFPIRKPSLLLFEWRILIEISHLLLKIGKIVVARWMWSYWLSQSFEFTHAILFCLWNYSHTHTHVGEISDFPLLCSMPLTFECENACLNPHPHLPLLCFFSSSEKRK